MAHQHYKGTGQMHSFRGLLADDKQDKIRIEGATGEIAWRITKFQIMASDPISTSQESVVKIYRETQKTLANTIDFTDDELLAASYMENDNSGSTPTYTEAAVIFDNALFVRNIYISHTAQSTSSTCNYYIELEEVKVSAAGMAQLAVAASRRSRFTSE